MVAAMALLLGAAPAGGAPAAARAQTADESLCLAHSGAALVGLRLGGESLSLDDDAIRRPDVPLPPYGLATWQPLVVPFQPTIASVRSESNGAVELDLRTSPDGVRWSGWVSAVEREAVALGTARFVQARATLSEGLDGTEPSLTRVCLDLVASPEGELVASEAATDSPTVRVWATREGMVGGRTANGHVITDRDHFVALPSGKALARLDGTEYQVRLKYNGRETTAPVWDVGPWNTKDNYWDPPADRELFKDLPRFFPQALAAWRDGHNAGRDQFGRWVTYPAAIDIADGTFLDDLGMQAPDWVDATFTWVSAPSPSPLPNYPRILSGKPPGTAGQQAAASEPAPGQRWYFAEGSTRAPFQMWLLVQNPSSDPAQVTLTYMLTDGTTRSQSLRLAPTSRQSVFANQVLPDAEFSTRVDSDRPVFAERAMYFRKDGHATTGAQRPEKRWCTADGVTRDGADTWLLVQNPGSAPAHANFTFLLEGGGLARFATDVGATSRLSLYANLVVPNTSFSACVETDQPVIVERATYLANGGGNGGMGVTGPSATWYFAEGNTLAGLTTRLALGNPNAEASQVDITYLREAGGPVKRTVTVPPMGRLTVDPSADVPGARFGVVVAASKPVVADRTVVFGPAGMGTHSSAGVPALARTWYLPEGSTAPPFQEWILVANPGETATNLTLDFMREDGTVLSRRYSVDTRARLSVDVNAEVPNAAVSVRASSDKPVVVERSMYWDGLSGGTNTAGIPWDR